MSHDAYADRPFDPAEYRRILIARGALRPDAERARPLVWLDSPPTLRLDDAGRASAARTIARPLADPDRELHRQQPPTEWAERQKDEP